jgi:CHAT domain-containing protein
MYLPTDGTPLVVEPHAALWLLPFAALQSADGTWLADQWPLLYTPSTQTLDDIRSEVDYGEPSSLTALIIGNPAMPTVPAHDGVKITLAPLPGAEQEAQVIAEILAPRSTVLLGTHADRTTVMAAAQQHGILHLATHGVAYANNPLASFVALAQGPDGNGLFTARDVMELSLPADLVTLSACQSGLGHVSGDGMIGLSRAFLVAGARSVLVSQWSVDDQATALLMAEFYRHYLEQDNKAAALQLAMRAIRTMADHPEYQHPRYWSPFVVVGAES